MFQQPIYITHTAAIHPSLVDSPDWIPGRQLFAEEPDYKELITNPTIRRRMSRIVRMGVAAGLQCLSEVETDKPGAILTATGLGCLSDTEKFMQTILDNDEELLPPTAFIQSTFNTIGAQIALLKNNHCYNTTYVHRGFSFESALLDAALLIAEKETDLVLAGAVDELTPTLYNILERFGCLKKSMAGEGAAFFLLSEQPAIGTVAALSGIEMFNGTFSRDEIQAKSRAFQERNRVNATTIYPEEFKQHCGEYPTAMSFGLWYTCQQMTKTLSNEKHILLCNSFLNNHSFILLKNVAL